MSDADLDALVQEAEALCRTVAPLDLAGREVYVVPVTRLGDFDPGLVWYGGCWAPGLAEVLRPALGARWRGPGFACIVNPTALPEHPGARRLRCLAVTLHELAHGVAAGEFDPGRPPPAVPPAALAELAAWSRGPAPPGPPGAGPWLGHEWPFVIAALHLAHRARVAGVPLRVGDLVNFGFYGLSCGSDYEAAAGDAPAELAHLPLSEVLLRTPGVRELFKADCRRWAACVQTEKGDPMNEVNDVATAWEQAEAERESEYEQLVERTAADDKPGAEARAVTRHRDVITATGRGKQQWDADLARARECVRLRKLVANRPAVAARAATARTALAKLEKERRAFLEEWEKKDAHQRRLLGEAETEDTAAELAGDQLQRLAWPRKRKPLLVAQQTQDALRARGRQAERALLDARGLLATAQARGDAEATRTRERQLAQAEQALADVQGQLAEANREEAAEDAALRR